MANFRIKELCSAKGITQKELAERIGISAVGLAKAIAGNTTINTLERIAEALDVNVTQLFEEHKEKAEFICPHCGKIINLEINVK